MNKLDKRWSRFKQELPSIIVLSILAIWSGFYWPAFIKMEAPWSTVYFVFRSILGIAIIIFVFFFMDTIFGRFNKLAPAVKKFSITTQVIVFSVGTLLLWYMDLFGLSNVQYAFFYATCLITFALIYRAASRVGTEN